jgi:nucleotide-binding universal stress UspA family protein
MPLAVWKRVAIPRPARHLAKPGPAAVGFPYRTILVPMDLDEGTGMALRVAEEIARQSAGVVYLLHVVPADEFGLLQQKYRPWESGGASVAAAMQVAATELAARGRARLAADVPREILTRPGDPAETVLRIQKEIAADVVVLTTCGHCATPSSLGGIVESVVRNAPCPVITVRR